MVRRVLVDWIAWKGYISKCKLSGFRWSAISLSLFLVFLICILESVHCSENEWNSVGSNSNYVNKFAAARTISEHGLFRHDHSSQPPRSDSGIGSGSTIKDIGCQNGIGCQSSTSPSSDSTTEPDRRETYTYDRFKRSVTTLNFHPRTKSESASNVGIKPLRIFKYITEDDVLANPDSHPERQIDTIFKPFVKGPTKNKSDDKGDNEDSSLNSGSRHQIVGGARVNLKAKLDKGDIGNHNNETGNQVINSNEANNHTTHHQSNNEPDSESKSQPPLQKISPPRPENIFIFKPTLAIRKNKTSLIPGGKYYYSKASGSGVVGVNRISAATSTTTATVPPPQREQHREDESTDPNSSTVNDRSLIHGNNNKNLYFDSVVMLNEEEGQKQLLHQHQHFVEEAAAVVESHRETTRNSVVGGGSSNSASSQLSNTHINNVDGGAVADDEDGDDEMMKNSNAPHTTSAFTSSNGSGNGIKSKTSLKKSSSNLLSSSMDPDHIVGSSSMNEERSVDAVEKLIHKINATLAAVGGNKDRVILKVVKSKKSKFNNVGKFMKQPKSILLAQDDIAQDGSERARRSSPFIRMPIKLSSQQAESIRRAQLAQANNNNNNGGQQLTRAALFRRNTILPTRVIRTRPVKSAKNIVVPRILTSASVLQQTLPGRTFLPVGQVTMNANNFPLNVQNPPNLALVPGPVVPVVGPGPVGPAISAIKVTQLHPISTNTANRNLVLPQQKTGLTLPNGKDLLADSTHTIYTYKPLPEDVLLNQAASSHYSPTYKRFKNKFNNEMTSLMESQRDLEDTVTRWEESRFLPGRHAHASRHHHHHHHHPHDSKHRSRSSGRHQRSRHHHRHHHMHERPPHSHHRSGQHHTQHHPRPSPARGKKLNNPKYAYPKNAENIQDILKFFDKEGPPHGPPEHIDMFDKAGSFHPKKHPHNSPRRHPHPHHTTPHPSALPPAHPSQVFPNSQPKLADLSGEFRDVHASLLKDIREFAKRPNLFGASSSSQPSTHHSGDSSEPPFDPIHEIFGEKPKPVRDMIKPDLYSLENIRERIAFKRGKLHGKFRDKDHGGDKETHGDMHHRHVDHDDDDYYDSNHRPSSSRHQSDGHSGEQTKNSLFSREDYDNPTSTYNRRDKYKDSSRDDSHAMFPSSHYKDSQRDSSNPLDFQSSELPSKPPYSTKPIVLKRPNESFKVRETEPKKKPEHDYFWNTFANFEKHHDSAMKSQTPSILQPISFSSSTQPLGKPLSSEDEDIVEIHTGGPGSGSHSGSVLSFPAATPSVTDHQIKQEKLKKLYIDVLQQKAQIEAALMHPHSVPSIHSQLIPTLHTSASLQPQHSPFTLSRIPTQLTNFHAGTQPVTLPPLTGITGISRRKKPMRMKIHIYPNGNDGIEQGLEAANLLAAGGFGTSGYSASNPPGILAQPPKDIGMASKVAHDSAMFSGPTGSMPMPTSPSGYGSASTLTGPMMTGPATAQAAPAPVSKNKNVVLHLHVHRRNDMVGPLELETEGSAPVAATAKPPLTFK